MTTRGRWIAALAALLVVVAGAAVAVYFTTARSTEVLSVQDMRSALLTEADRPAGTIVQEMEITPAGLAASQGGMVVSPESCLGALQVALGPDAQVTGWMQIGSTPTGRGQFQSAVGRVDGGLDVARLREAVGTCKSGTITWPELKLTAAISLTEIPAPAVEGASTFSYKSTIRFTKVTENQLTVALSCFAGDSFCPTPNRSDTPMDLAVEQFFSYAATDDLYVESCAGSQPEVEGMLTAVFNRLREDEFV